LAEASATSAFDFSGHYDLSGSATFTSEAEVWWNVYSSLNPVSGSCDYFPGAADGNCPLGGGEFSGTFHAFPGGSVRVTLEATAQLTGDPLGGESTATAYIDPYSYIDPAWAAQNPGYSLVFSPGIGNSLPAPSPQPSTFGAVAFGLLGFASARQRLKRRLRS
jgi:hypothetical protein